MDSVWNKEPNPKKDIHSSPELEYLFDMVADRFNEASKRQSRNRDVSYYTIEALGKSIYYTITLASSYLDIINKNKKADILEVLVPGIIADTESPIIEQINDNEKASFVLRKFIADLKDPVYLHVDTKKLKIKSKNKTEFSSQDNEELDKNEVKPEDVAFEIATKIRDYELIPSNVPPRYAPTELIMKEFGIFPTDAWQYLR